MTPSSLPHLFTALANQGVDPAYITILRDLYNGATSTLKLHKDSNKISLERGARQGDNISPKLFTACLQDAIINKIDWEEKGINIDGEHLSHLIFTNDIILIAHTPQELQEMLVDINNYSKPVGLNMHLGKTKIMLNNHTEKATVEVDGKAIEEVEKYVYLGKTVFKGWRPNARDQEMYHFGMGCLQQGRQYHEKPQSKLAGQEKSVQ